MNKKAECPPHIAICVYDTPDGKVGGPIAWALDFIPFLAGNYVTTALVLRPGGEAGSNVADRLKERGIPCHSLDTSIATDLNSQVEWIYRKARECRFHIVVSNLVLPALYASEGLRRGGIATIGILHSHPDYDPFYRDVVDVFANEQAEVSPDCLVAVSRQIAERIPQNRLNGPRVEVIPCGTRFPLPKTNQNVDQPRAVYAGRLVQFPKRIKETVGAFLSAAAVTGTGSTIVGDGDQRDWICKELGGQSRVQYGGVIAPSDMHSVYCSHQIFVLLSDFEGLPIALVEAMACGLVPVGMVSAPGINEVIVDGVNGLLLPDREQSFVEAMRALQDKAVRKRLSEAAIKTVEEQYSHSMTFALWQKLLEQLTPQTITPSRIPRRCVVKNRDGRFEDYPPNRPPSGDLARLWLLGIWNKMRLAIRPRSRIRAFLGR